MFKRSLELELWRWLKFKVCSSMLLIDLYPSIIFPSTICYCNTRSICVAFCCNPLCDNRFHYAIFYFPPLKCDTVLSCRCILTFRSYIIPQHHNRMWIEWTLRVAASGPSTHWYQSTQHHRENTRTHMCVTRLTFNNTIFVSNKTIHEAITSVRINNILWTSSWQWRW